MCCKTLLIFFSFLFSNNLHSISRLSNRPKIDLILPVRLDFLDLSSYSPISHENVTNFISFWVIFSHFFKKCGEFHNFSTGEKTYEIILYPHVLGCMSVNQKKIGFEILVLISVVGQKNSRKGKIYLRNIDFWGKIYHFF